MYPQANYRNRKVMKRSVPYGYEGPTMSNTSRPVAASLKEKYGNGGIGIVNFLQGKTFLITGATGFLAKGVCMLN